MRFSILSWNAGQRRGKVTNRFVCCFREIVKMLRNSSIFQGADRLILFHQNTFEPGGMKTKEVIPGTSKHDSFGLKYLIVRLMFRTWRLHPHTCLCELEQHDCEEARHCKAGFWASSGNSQSEAMRTSLRATSTPRPSANAERRT